MNVNLEDKKIFLIVSASAEKLEWSSQTIRKLVARPTIFEARDGITALSKLQNAPPHVLITDVEIPKLPTIKFLDSALASKGAEATAVIVAGAPPAEGHHLDELVTGRLQYFTVDGDEAEFAQCLARALNYSSQQQEAEFFLRFLAPGDVLLHEGDKAEYVYFVKKGRLRAYRVNQGKEVDLGSIEYGEFVGEMAYINGEPRNANVQALTACELIEVDIGKFDKVLFQRPSWSKALMMTLTKRVKAANDTKLDKV